jgi:hypothetical protein
MIDDFQREIIRRVSDLAHLVYWGLAMEWAFRVVWVNGCSEGCFRTAEELAFARVRVDIC